MPSLRHTHSFCGRGVPSPTHSVVTICLHPLTLWSRYAFTKATHSFCGHDMPSPSHSVVMICPHPLILWSRYAFTLSFCSHDMPSPTHSVVTICLHQGKPTHSVVTICLHHGKPTHSVVTICLHPLILWSRYAFTHSFCGHDMRSPRQPTHSVVTICLHPLILWSPLGLNPKAAQPKHFALLRCGSWLSDIPRPANRVRYTR